jgi:hypothetical protein
MKRIGLLAAAMILLGMWAWRAHDRLAEARRAQAAALAATRPPRVAADALLPAGTAADAQRQIGRMLGDAAADAGVRVALAPLVARFDGVVQIRVDAHGPEDRLRAFVSAAESPSSPVRFVTWAIGPDGGGALRLTGDAAAAWRSSPAADAIRLVQADPAPTAPARTLFAIDPVADARPAVDAAPELIGIAGRLPDDAIALVRLPDGATRDLRIGQSANGWRLATIAFDRISLVKGAKQRELVLPARQ